MNGIAGIVYPDLFQMNDLIQPMLQSLNHRCSEVPVVHTHKNIQIGGCGSLTAYNRNQSIFCALDGEIQNRIEVANSLRIKAPSDAELIVRAYEVWGMHFLNRLTGDFAFAILDQNKRKLILARDRIGRKPLYWFQNQHHFIFGSELKSILSTGAVPQTAAIDSLSSYLYFGYIPQDMSPIKDVNKLLPSHYLQFSFDGNISISSYWSYSSYFEKTSKSSKEQILNNLDHLFEKSIKQSLPKNITNIGCMLSGGLGSASVAYYLQKTVPKEDLKAYSVGFYGESEGDIESAKLIAENLDIQHERHSITQQKFVDDLVQINWFLDEPIADPNVIATWNLSAIASKSCKTVYSGMGSDELFAGHSRYTTKEQTASFFRQMTQTWLHSFQKVLVPIIQTIYKPLAYQLMKESRTNPWQFEYLKYNAYFTEAEMERASPRLSGIFDPEVFLHKFHHLNRVHSTVASYLYFDVKTRLVDCYIHQFERLTSAHGLNWKSPFLNRDMVEFLASLPEPDYLEEEQAATYLKSLMKNSLPEQIIKRPKRTRQSFLKNWMECEEVKELFKKLPKGTLVDNGLISQAWLNQQINSLGSSNSSYRYLWSILQLEIWFRLFINHPITSSPPKISAHKLLDEPA